MRHSKLLIFLRPRPALTTTLISPGALSVCFVRQHPKYENFLPHGWRWPAEAE